MSPAASGPDREVTGPQNATEWLLSLVGPRRLSPTQRRVAQYLLGNLPDAAFLSSVDLATRAGVSQPSVTRFAVALGFSGYPELRNALRRAALGSPMRTTGALNDLQAAVAVEIANLETLREYLADPSDVRTLARELALSSPLVVIGAGPCAPLAQYVVWAARRIHPDVRCVVEIGRSAFETLVQASIAGGSWTLTFALGANASDVTGVLRFARLRGLRTAVVAEGALDLAVEHADVVIPVPLSSRTVFDSYAAPFVLTAVLLQRMAEVTPARTRSYLEAHEHLVPDGPQPGRPGWGRLPIAGDEPAP